MRLSETFSLSFAMMRTQNSKLRAHRRKRIIENAEKYFVALFAMLCFLLLLGPSHRFSIDFKFLLLFDILKIKFAYAEF